MKITIDESILERYNLQLEEFFAISLLRSGINIPDLLAEMVAGDKIRYFPDTAEYKINAYWLQCCDKILLESDKSLPKESKLLPLAKKLQAVFPKGQKPGTNYYYKCNSKDVALKLAKFFKLYGSNYTEEDIINATQRYVDSFNGDYTYMRLLKYFIMKDEVSELATWLENEDTEDNDFMNFLMNEQ